MSARDDLYWAFGTDADFVDDDQRIAWREALDPDALIVPLVGFDPQRFRLGYGGGYYDRTIAAAARRPYCVGLGFEEARLESIFPQAHDIPMDLIVTDGVSGVDRRSESCST